MIELKILYVKDCADFDKERIVLEVLQDCDIGNYLIQNTRVDENTFSNKPFCSFWFPDKRLQRGDKLVLYTKKGNNKVKKTKQGHNIFFYYWGQEMPIWGNGGTCSVLIKVSDYTVFIP